MKLSVNQSFALAAVTLILAFATAGAPISLFNIYRIENGLTNADLGFVSLCYFLSAATALLVFGRLSQFVGRRPMSMLALTCIIVSCLLLMNMQNVSTLLVARVLQGFACGIASSSVSAYVVDTSDGRPRWLVAALTGSAPMIGIASGAILSGGLVTWLPFPRVLILAVILSVASVSFLLFWGAKETVVRKPGAIKSLIPHLYFPFEHKWSFLTLAFCVISTWSLGAFYQAFGPSIISEQLQTGNAFVLALAFSSVMILTPMGSFFCGFLRPRRALKLGMAMHILALLFIWCSFNYGWLQLFVAASLLSGLAQGIATTSGLKILIPQISQDHRAGFFSTFYVASYSGAVFPSLAGSVAAKHVSVLGISMGYVSFGVVTAVLAIAMSYKITKPNEASLAAKTA